MSRATRGSPRGASLRQLSGSGRVWLLSGSLAAAALLLYAGTVATIGIPRDAFGPRWWGLVALFALAEVFVVHLRFMRDAHTFSMGEIPIILGLFFLSPIELMPAQMVGAGLTVLFVRKQSPLKAAFNVSKWAFETSLAILIFQGVSSLGPLMGPAGWAGAFAATLTVDVIAGVLINIAISLSQGTRPQFPHMGVGTAAVFANTCLSLVAVTVLWWQPSAAWLLVALAAVVYLAYRAYGSVTHKHESMRLLYETTRVAQGSVQLDSMLQGILAHAREMFRAEFAEIDLFAVDDEGFALRTSISPKTTEVMAAVELDPRSGVWARVASEGDALLFPRPIANPKLQEYFGGRGLRDAMVAPIRSDAAVVGTLLVGNRMGDFSTFDEDDLKVLETLTNHVSISLENGRLVDTLRLKAEENERLALHDALTGLPNRVLFQDRIRSAIETAQQTNQLMGVMLMDLDRFKEVNDTLGHHNGDLLLREVGDRLRGAVKHTDVVARLGGDEFAILLTDIREANAAERIARRVLEALEHPMHLEHLTIDVGASIGIAVFPHDADDADTLLQRADVAMYVAKEAHTGFEVYSGDKDRYSPDRLGLVAELRSAIDNRTLSLVYQPKIDLRVRRITGFEALVRWQHPRRGFLSPDEFIPIAEHTGLIMPLTIFVLDEALRECNGWMSRGHSYRVAVNLSARSLLNSRLPDEVARSLAHWHVPAELLQLEITESSLLGDPERSGEILQRLADMGVGLSIDDYGTGFSSLSHLRRLPVSEIKIDKTFVMEMDSAANDEAIVRSTIELGHILGMTVVAEGVESRDVLERLAGLGCDEAQGYHLSRPLDPSRVPEWIEEFGEPVRGHIGQGNVVHMPVRAAE